MKKESCLTRRRILGGLLFGSPLALSGCLSVKELDDIQARWDRKHPEGTGIMMSKAPELIRVLATYRATQVQRAAVEERGRRAYAKMLRDRRRQVTVSSKPKSATTRTATIVSVSRPDKPLATASSPADTQRKTVELAAQTKETVVALPQFIAVEAPKDERFSGKSAIGLWSTATQELSGNLIGDLSEKPKPGAVVSAWGGKVAEYVGS